MKPRYEIFLFLLLFTLLFEANAQANQPRIAVIPLNHINVSKSDAEAITGLFETALVKTEIFDVIEQGQVNEILEAQEYSMSDCTDEQCAVEFGKLLAAERIVLGTLSAVGGKYILNAKIIDVATGKNIKADRVDADSLAEMTDMVELLAFKLAGLTFSKGAQVEIARVFSEVFIKTEPSGAEICVNGVKKGLSPNLVSKVPLGVVKIECQKGNLYGVKYIEIVEKTTTVQIKLTETYGNIFIESSDSEAKAYLDNNLLGDLSSGFFEKIPTGEYILELKGNGTYWKDEIAIRANESTRVEAYPRAFGDIFYHLPEEVSAEVEGSMFREVVSGEGLLTPVWEGNYTIRVKSKVYEPYSHTITIKRGMSFKFKPRLHYLSEYAYAKYTKEIEDTERFLSENKRIEQNDIDNMVDLKAKIKASKHTFADLIAKTEFLISEANEKKKVQEKEDNIEELYFRKQEVENSILRLDQKNRIRAITKWASLGTGILSLGFSGFSWYLSDKAYDDYENATITEDVIKYRDKFKMWDTTTYLAGGVGGLGIGFSIFLWATNPGMDKHKAELVEIETQINKLEQELK